MSALKVSISRDILTNDRLEAQVLFLLLDLLDRVDEILELIEPIRDKSRLLLQIKALLNKGALMLQKAVDFLKLCEHLIEAEVFVFCLPDEVL